MGVGYTITTGYGDARWEDLKEAALEICDLPIMIYNEAIAFGAPAELDDERLGPYCVAFEKRTDLTIEFVEPGHTMWDSKYEKPFIHMMASGGDPGRTMKEHTRRAFLRLIMAAMHRQDLEICITVG